MGKAQQSLQVRGDISTPNIIYDTFLYDRKRWEKRESALQDVPSTIMSSSFSSSRAVRIFCCHQMMRED